MVWSHPEIGLEEMARLVKGFVDILMLSSGHQSSDLAAHWDAANVKRAFQWAAFFERVLSELKSSEYYDESVEELNAALSGMKSHSSFPQGLAKLSSDTLSRARGLVAEHFINTLSLRDSHLKAVLMAAVELDLSAVTETAQEGLTRYLHRLSLQNNSINSLGDSTSLTEGIEDWGDYDWTSTSIRELSRRQSTVSSILSLQESLSVFFRTIESSCMFTVDQSKYKNVSVSKDEMTELITWNRWKMKNLMYFLDKRTIRMISGASMMFSCPKNQWLRVFECLAKSEKFIQRVEVLLLGCIKDRWSWIIKHFQSVTFDRLTTLDRFSELHNLHLGRSQRPPQIEEYVNSKEKSILDYLTGLLGSELHVLWTISPVLLAAAISYRSTMFRLYLSHIEICLKGEPDTLRCCGCIEERKEHKDCELAERIWCLYAFQVSSSLFSDR